MYLWDYCGDILSGVWEAEQLQETVWENWPIWGREQVPDWKDRTVQPNQTFWLLGVRPRLSLSLWWAAIWWTAGAFRLWLQKPVVPNSNRDESKHCHWLTASYFLKKKKKTRRLHTWRTSYGGYLCQCCGSHTTSCAHESTAALHSAQAAGVCWRGANATEDDEAR